MTNFRTNSELDAPLTLSIEHWRIARMAWTSMQPQYSHFWEDLANIASSVPGVALRVFGGPSADLQEQRTETIPADTRKGLLATSRSAESDLLIAAFEQKINASTAEIKVKVIREIISKISPDAG